MMRHLKKHGFVAMTTVIILFLLVGARVRSNMRAAEEMITLSVISDMAFRHPDSITIKWTNPTEHGFMFGYAFTLSRRTFRSWELISPKEEAVRLTALICLGSSTEHTYDLKERYGELGPGLYRFQTEYTHFDGSEDRRSVFVDFWIGSSVRAAPQVDQTDEWLH